MPREWPCLSVMKVGLEEGQLLETAEEESFSQLICSARGSSNAHCCPRATGLPLAKKGKGEGGKVCWMGREGDVKSVGTLDRNIQSTVQRGTRPGNRHILELHCQTQLLLATEGQWNLKWMKFKLQTSATTDTCLVLDSYLWLTATILDTSIIFNIEESSVE